jgi:hypothetical protein
MPIVSEVCLGRRSQESPSANRSERWRPDSAPPPNMGRLEAYRALLARGFRTDIQGVTMHRSNGPGYSQPGVYIIDD